MPGRPRDVVGLKAMAIASQRWYENFRPSGVKVHAGAPVIEHGMVEQDFKDLADAGVKVVGRGRPRHGQGRPPPVSKWTTGRANTEFKARSTPAARRSPAPGWWMPTWCWETGTDVVGHINGGHSALPDDQDHLPVRKLQSGPRDRPQRQRTCRDPGRSTPRASLANWIRLS